MKTDIDEVLENALVAEEAMLEEYRVQKQTYETNPIMTALARGINSVREMSEILREQ